jgi:hypothetical protein
MCGTPNQSEGCAMSAKRKLWKVTTATDTFRPESQAKVYSIYIPNERVSWSLRNPELQAQTRDVHVWVDERDGNGWQLFEKINLSQGGSDV